MSQKNYSLKISVFFLLVHWSRNDPKQFKTIFETLTNSEITDYKNKIVVLCVEINKMSFMNYYKRKSLMLNVNKCKHFFFFFAFKDG